MGLPAVLDPVGDQADSDVEEDPFAEFTVMDGLEGLDEMLADQDGGSAAISHGIEPSESLATGAVASVQPGISDAMQSDIDFPGAADEATQPLAVEQGAYVLADGKCRKELDVVLQNDNQQQSEVAL